MRARRSFPALLALSLLAAAGACRDSGDDGNNPIDARDGDAPDPDDMKIQMVQDDATPVGTAVTLRGVVVVAKDNFGNRNGNFHVMEPEGGPFSGVLVFGAPLEQFDAISVGDLVDITNAEKDEFGLDTDTSTFTELIGAGGGDMVVTKVGTGTVPAPHVLDALAIGRMGEAMAREEYEKWEHVLVTVENVSVTRAIRCIGTACSDPSFKDFGITGYLLIDSSLAEIPDALVMPQDCVASVSGVMDYFFDYKILPRATSDIVTGGTNCPAPENTAEQCGDGIDNDANGFADCNDRACLSIPSCTTNTTIENIQNGTVTAGSVVALDHVIVTAIDTIGSTQGVWVSQFAQSAANQGIFVYTGNMAPAVTIGQFVDVTGSVSEFDVQPPTGDTLTELVQATVTADVGSGTPLPLMGVPAATLASIDNGEPYESVFVNLTNMRVMSEVSPGDRVVLTDGTNTIVMDDDIFNYAAGAYPTGTCFSSVSGIMTVNLFDDERRFLPRSAADLVSAACP